MNFYTVVNPPADPPTLTSAEGSEWEQVATQWLNPDDFQEKRADELTWPATSPAVVFSTSVNPSYIELRVYRDALATDLLTGLVCGSSELAGTDGLEVVDCDYSPGVENATGDLAVTLPSQVKGYTIVTAYWQTDWANNPELPTSTLVAFAGTVE